MFFQKEIKMLKKNKISFHPNYFSIIQFCPFSISRQKLAVTMLQMALQKKLKERKPLYQRHIFQLKIRTLTPNLITLYIEQSPQSPTETQIFFKQLFSVFFQIKFNTQVSSNK